jgi:hypothetical protein
VEEIKSHPWFREINWDTLRDIPAPHIPEGSTRIKPILNELKDVDSTSPEYHELITELTRNFDEFPDNGTVWGKGTAKAVTRVDTNDQFIGYTFKRQKVKSHDSHSSNLQHNVIFLGCCA